MPSSFIIDDLGGRIATVWSELRPATRGLVERALQAAATGNQTTRNFQYDARADLELSRFLAALDAAFDAPLDDRAAENTNALDAETRGKLKSLADTTAAVLQEQTESAEVFAQLVRRAESQRDYKRIDTLADALTSRFPPSEICELARSEDAIVRELANEALARCPISLLIGLLNDPVDAETARSALRRQVAEYGSEEARRLLTALDQEEFI
ncbi:MAG TPA: hypothetical protein VFT02_07720 [Pyrinomonadaceae bacterium]|nr:hypothetical protein [Pyrinomonadaceae bacterium]